ncbi:hypothetical protein THAOC_25696, partial [Thalassiosira oceanica]
MSGRKRKHDPQSDGVFLYEGGEVAEDLKSDITRIRVGPQVKDIPIKAFQGCTNLVEVQFDEGMLRVIGDRAFRDCIALQQVAIPSSVTKVGSYAFYGCRNLIKLQFNEGLDIIGKCAYHGCQALQQ